MIRVDTLELRKSALRLRQAAGGVLDGLAFEAAEHLAREARERTPVDTGRLRAGWYVAETGALSAEVRNPVAYASFVEFDTRHWVSGGIVPGRRFLGRAMAETEAALPEMAEARLREVIGRCFGG